MMRNELTTSHSLNGLTNSAVYSYGSKYSHPRPGFKQMLLHASLRWQRRFSNVSIAFFHDACKALCEAGRSVKFCKYENDIRCVASIKREELNLSSKLEEVEFFSF